MILFNIFTYEILYANDVALIPSDWVVTQCAPVNATEVVRLMETPYHRKEIKSNLVHEKKQQKTTSTSCRSIDNHGLEKHRQILGCQHYELLRASLINVWHGDCNSTRSKTPGAHLIQANQTNLLLHSPLCDGQSLNEHILKQTSSTTTTELTSRFVKIRNNSMVGNESPLGQGAKRSQ